MRVHKFKYEIGYRYDQYEIIDTTSYSTVKGSVIYLYVVKCLKCGSVIKRLENKIDKKVKCRECMRRMEYSKYNVGDIVNGLEIMEKSPIFSEKNNRIEPAYFCRCIKDGYESIHREDNLIKGKGCPVCAGNKIVKGINDINTVAPWLGNLLVNKEDGYKYSVGSKTKLCFKCPICGTVTKPIYPYSVYVAKRFKCPCCSDGVSMPEKILYSILSALNINFEYQKNFNWSDKKRYYDFYLPDKSMIIETHGRQHYNTVGNLNWDSLEKTQSNDEYKRILAKNNGIKNYIEIDCSDSNPVNLINKFKIDLSEYFNFNNLDENQIIRNSLSSFCVQAGNLWNDGMHDSYEIANNLKLNHGTIRKYLKTLTKINYLNIPYPTRERKLN